MKNSIPHITKIKLPNNITKIFKKEILLNGIHYHRTLKLHQDKAIIRTSKSTIELLKKNET